MHRFIFFALIAAASASYVTYDGPCPAVKPVDNFDFAAFQGRWYETARYPSPHEGGLKGKCTVADYLVYGSTGRVKNSQVIDGVKLYTEGDIAQYAPGVIMYTYTYNGVSKNFFLTILDTDYTSYAIGYSCKYFPYTNKHEVYSWILSRNLVLEPYARAAVDNYLNVCPVLDASKYVTNDYSPETCIAPFVGLITNFRQL
ncbi:bilin-binding protein-like [Battus philenor]|uniref:bilin-binding protein-like n=1 Tax=Battus philenor TaxID=42288 RepID=UPI0035D08013